MTEDNSPRMRTTRRAAVRSAVIVSSDSEEDAPKTKRQKKTLSDDEGDWAPKDLEVSEKKSSAKAPVKRKAPSKAPKKEGKAPVTRKRKVKDVESAEALFKEGQLQTEEKVERMDVDDTDSMKAEMDISEEEAGSKTKAKPVTKRAPKKAASTKKSSAGEDKANDGKENDSDLNRKSESDQSAKASQQLKMAWQEADLLAEVEGIELWVAQNLTNLFNEDNTIPFIARYRKELTRNMEPEQLRHAKDTFEEIKQVKQKASTILKNVEKLGKLNPQIERSILCARSISELEHINAPFKTGSKRTLAERARQAGLEPAALALLDGSERVNLGTLINPDKEGLHNEEEVKNGIQHIIADVMSKDQDVLELIRTLRKETNIRLESSRAKGTTVKELTKGSKTKTEGKLTPNTAAAKREAQAKRDEESKFRNYFEFSTNIKYIKPHQVLAINRGESLKELTVRVVVPDFVLHRLSSFCKHRWLSTGLYYEARTLLIESSIKDAYNRLIQPLIIRQVRAELNQEAERASIEVFATNLKKLLLMPPFRGHTVLGIDPGFRNGCKAAVVGPTGGVLETGVLYLHCSKKSQYPDEDKDALWLKRVLMKHRCEFIALGNGTACRETEAYLSNLIQRNWFGPHLDVSYTIVSEQGASIYSCGEEAKKEFPTMDPNIISAISLARRLQDPLTELVKVEPKHLGVGMYQHDVPEKQLTNTLNEVVVECVSFVGTDINTAPHCLLRRIAGLNTSRADKIIEYRQKNGTFKSREHLKKIKGIGEKSYEQCAGFIRILPETAASEDSRIVCNPLDRTWIHPESYDFAKRFMDYCGVKIEDFGSPVFNENIRGTIERAGGTSNLANKLGKEESLVKLVSEGLQLSPNHDFRSEFQKPLFRKGMTSFDDLNCGDILTGRVTNTTHFGAFVDIGVGTSGLIHAKFMRNMTPNLGDKVEVRVVSYEKARKRVGLELLAIL